MSVLPFDIWQDKVGYKYGDSIQEWLEEQRPCSISLEDLGIYDIDDFIQDKILEAYEEYISDVEDYEYDKMKDERI